MVAIGPEIIWVRSITRIPSSGPAIAEVLLRKWKLAARSHAKLARGQCKREVCAAFKVARNVQSWNYLRRMEARAEVRIECANERLGSLSDGGGDQPQR